MPGKIRRRALINGADLTVLANHANKGSGGDDGIPSLNCAVGHAPLQIKFQHLDEVHGATLMPNVGEIVAFECAIEE